MSAGSEKNPLSTDLDLDGPLPWSMIIDRDMRVVDIGRSLARHAPTLSKHGLVGDSLRIQRPKMSIHSFEDLASLEGRMIMVALGEQELQMRGSFFPHQGRNSLIFVGSPVLTSSDDLARTGIELGDFAPHDILPDLLFAIQARDVSIIEARESYRKQAHISQRLKAILDSAWDAMITIDSEGKIVELNDVAVKTFGYDRPSAIGQHISRLLLTAEHRSLFEQTLQDYDESENPFFLNRTIELMALCVDDRTIPIELTIIPFTHDDGRFFTATIRDLTEQRRKDALISKSRRQEMLLHRELDHRVKNMLAQIVVLCRQALSKSSEDQELVSALTKRVENYSAIHELLSKKSVTGVEMGSLAETCLLPYLSGIDSCFKTSGEPLYVKPSIATTLAIVLNELATNAAKYGALHHADGQIFFTWCLETDPKGESVIKLTWQERHEGKMPKTLEGGLGTEILRSVLSYQYEAICELETLDDGMIFRTTIPATTLVIQSDS